MIIGWPLAKFTIFMLIRKSKMAEKCEKNIFSETTLLLSQY
jgi:hypothetical protein